MKKISLLSLVLISTSSFASCPDLTSLTKVCRSSTGQTPGNIDQSITQELIDGVTNYIITFTSNQSGELVTKTLIADGKSRREIAVDEDTGISLLTVTTVTCSGDALLAHETAFIDGQFLGILDVKTTKSKNIVTSVYEGIRWGRDVDDTVVCE